MARNFRELEERMRPEVRARVKARAEQVMADMLLAQIREAAGLTQKEVAANLGIRQPTLSRMESQGDMQVRTLQRLVSALGGELELIAHIPGRDIRIRQFRDSD
jgi:transcriptional regulator with XRE-family HTH domain